jgi:hypothetical protein
MSGDMAQLLSCPDPDVLSRLVRGELPDPEAEPLEQHLSGCDCCGQAAAAITEIDPLTLTVRAGARFIAEVTAPHELMAQLRGWHALQPDALEGYPFLEAALEPGELGRLGRYRVLRVLGRGGMGVVFEAEDPELKRRVALKVLLDSRYANPHYTARFRGEAETVARLRHPNIVQIHEIGAHSGRPYLALELVEGGNLAEQLAGKPQPVRAAADLVLILSLRLEQLEDRVLLTNQPLTLADPSLNGISGLSDSLHPSMSADGQLIAFASRTDNLVSIFCARPQPSDVGARVKPAPRGTGASLQRNQVCKINRAFCKLDFGRKPMNDSDMDCRCRQVCKIGV